MLQDDRDELAMIEADEAGYQDFCPLSRAAEIFATRWTPLIIRNMLIGCESFSQLLDAAPGISRTLLSQRLRMLEHHGVVARAEGANGRATYQLTESGLALVPVVSSLASWGEQWVELSPEHFDATKVLWAFTKRLGAGPMPEDRTVVRFDVTEPERESYWVLMDPPNAEVCRRPPTDSDDFVVRASARTLVQWWLGEMSLGDAVSAGRLAADGPRELERFIAGWGGAGNVAGFGEALAKRGLVTAA